MIQAKKVHPSRHYLITLVCFLGSLSALGCPSSDSGANVGANVGVDSGANVGVDSGANVGADSGANVGEPCRPERIPDDGFNSAETYIETSSEQCESRVCIVNQFQGHPDDVPNEEILKERIHCSCRCDAPSADLDECDCPAGHACKEVLESGPARGGYCVNVKALAR